MRKCAEVFLLGQKRPWREELICLFSNRTEYRMTEANCCSPIRCRQIKTAPISTLPPVRAEFTAGVICESGPLISFCGRLATFPAREIEVPHEALPGTFDVEPHPYPDQGNDREHRRKNTLDLFSMLSVAVAANVAVLKELNGSEQPLYEQRIPILNRDATLLATQDPKRWD